MWTRGDRDKAIWWYLRRQSTCPSCGTREEEWDPARGGDRDAAYAPERHHCRGCQIKNEAEASNLISEADARDGWHLRFNRKR